MLRSVAMFSTLALMSSVSVPAFSQEPVRLTTVSGYPATAVWVDLFNEVYIPAVNEKLAETGNHKIDWTLGWGGALTSAGGEFDTLKEGLADIGVVVTVFKPDELSIYDVSYATPFTSTDIDLMSRTMNELAEEFPAMQEVWTRNNQVMLTAVAAVDDYNFWFHDPIESMEGMAGRKISAAGYGQRYLEPHGAVGVQGGLGDAYNNLATGLWDGSMTWADAAYGFKLFEAAPHILIAKLGGTASFALTVNLEKWESLPREVQDALSESAEEYREAVAVSSMEKASAAMAAMREAESTTVLELTDEQREAWANELPHIAYEWADALEADGVPGREILSSYMEKMRAGGATPMRDWSVE